MKRRRMKSSTSPDIARPVSHAGYWKLPSRLACDMVLVGHDPPRLEGVLAADA
jgi:hypothetical protein